MFNTTTINPESATIHQHLAPTADHLRLLNEMRDEARRSVIAEFSFGQPNRVFGTVTVVNVPWEQYRQVIIKFDINGAKHIVEERINEIDLKFDRKKALESLGRAITEQLFVAVTTEIAAGMS